MRIVVGEQTFNDGADSDGIQWMITSLDGWASPPVRASTLEPTYRHGSVPASAFYGPRGMTAKGVVKAPTEALFWVAYNRLLTLMHLNVERPVVVQETVEKTVWATKAADVRATFVGLGAITFEIPVTASDPLKYGDVVTTSVPAGATRTLVNDGNEPTPYVTATASATGTLSLKNLETEQTLTTGSSGVEAGTVTDFRGRTVYWNDVSRYGRLHPTSTWWMLQPGANRIVNAGSTTMTIAHRPAWA